MIFIKAFIKCYPYLVAIAVICFVCYAVWISNIYYDNHYRFTIMADDCIRRNIMRGGNSRFDCYIHNFAQVC